MYRLCALSTLILAATASFAQTIFEVPKVDSAMGTGFGGLIFGEDTDTSVKARFKTERGAIRPEALRLSQAPDSAYRVDALLAGRGKTAKVIGVRVEFLRTAPTREEFEALIGEPITPLFARNRYSDWAVLGSEAKGVIAFAMRTDRETRIDSVVFTDPGRARDLLRELSPSAGEIGNLQREFDRLDRTVRVRSVDVDISSKNITTPDRNREERELERYADRRYESRVIRYGGDGTISISVRLDFDKVEVSASLSARNEAGSVSASASGSGRFREANDIAYYDRGVITDLIERALDELSDDAEKAVRNQQPRTETEVRRTAILDLLNRYVK